MPLTDLLTAEDLPSRIPLPPDATAVEMARHAWLSLYRPVHAKFGTNSILGTFCLKSDVSGSASVAVLETVCHGQRYEWFLTNLPDFGVWKTEFAGLDLALLPEELALAVLDVVLEAPLKALEKTGLALRLDRFKLITASPEDGDLGWEISFPALQSHWHGFLRCEAAGLKLLKDVIETVPPELAESQAKHRMTLYNEWGHQWVSAETFDKLKLHDVILLNDADLQAQQGMMRVGVNFRVKTKWNGSHWNIVAPIRENPTGPEGQVRIGVSSCGISRTLEEIQALDLNSDLGFSAQPEHRVLIWSNNQIIAEGEWMTIGSASAVRIVETQVA